MSEQLKAHIKKFIRINEQDLNEVVKFFTAVDLKKKQNLLTEGKICTRQYFVVNGCLRMFFVNEKGVEVTIQFALENWWMSDYDSFSNHTPSEYHIQAVENTQVLAIDFAAQEQMLEQFPQMERYFRLIYQRVHAAFQLRIRLLYQLSREELYHSFNTLYPEFVQRIPQYLLASYLGFTPEYLSEIRSRKIS